MFSKILLVTLLSAFISTTNSFSSGAAGCGGVSAVGGPHVDDASKTVELTPWNSAGVTVKIGGKVVTPDSKITVTTGKSTSIELIGKPNFKGFLFRFQNAAEYEGLKVTPAFGTQVAINCKGRTLKGLTHINADEKKSAKGSFSLATVPGEDILFTTIVVYSNSDTLSKYTYANWTVTAKKAVVKPCKAKTCSFIQNFFGCTTTYCD